MGLVELEPNGASNSVHTGMLRDLSRETFPPDQQGETPAQPCSLQGTKPESPSCLFQIRVLTSRRLPGQAGLTASSILQVRSPRCQGRKDGSPARKTSRCPLLPVSPGPEGEGQVIHTAHNTPPPCPPSGPWMGKPQTLL